MLGNLPWVTIADLSTLGSENLPAKSNFQNRNGLDAITGKANFDISESKLIRLLEAMNGWLGTLAILCKASVARRTLLHGWKNEITLEHSAICRIEAGLHFDVAVDAVLLLTHFRPGTHDAEAKVYSRLSDADEETVIGYETACCSRTSRPTTAGSIFAVKRLSSGVRGSNTTALRSWSFAGKGQSTATAWEKSWILRKLTCFLC